MTVSPIVDRGEEGGLRVVAPVVVSATAVALPAFLVGALAVQIRREMHFSVAMLGVVVAAYQLAAAASSVPSTRLTRRLGAALVLRMAPLVVAVVLMAIAGLAGSWPVLIAMMVVAGVAGSSAQPAANLFLARRAQPSRQGLAFGIKQAAIPLAGLLSGLAVPAIALTVGWRWAFVLGAALAAAAGLTVRSRGRVESDTEPRAVGGDSCDEPRRALPVLAVGFGVSLVAPSSLAAFVVPAGVAAGMGKGVAGLVAALGAGAAVATRATVGYHADRRGEARFSVVAVLIAVGAAGFALLAAGSGLHLAAAFVPGVVLAYGVGWGWNGLFNLALVRTYPSAPAKATAAVQVGGRFGNFAGPLVVGVLAGSFGYDVAWAVAAAQALGGATIILVGRKLLRSAGAAKAPGVATSLRVTPLHGQGIDRSRRTRRSRGGKA